MFFHVGYLVAPRNLVVRILYTDALIVALANIEKLPAGVNAWLEMRLHTNSTLRYVKCDHIAPSTR